MNKRKRRYAALFVIGLAFVPLAISQGVAFYGVAVVFMVIGASGMRRERARAAQEDIQK